ncbi:MAG: Beta-hexosaminidase [Desulfovibrio sp.]
MRTVVLAFYVLVLSLVVPFQATAAPLPETLPLDAMIGQMVMVGFRGTGDENTSEMRIVLEDIRKGRIGGVIYFERDWETKKKGRNIATLAQTARLSALLQKNASIPLFIAVDQEGGRVQRLKAEHGFPATPPAAEMGLRDPKTTREFALVMGRNLKNLGINLNFAPVADVDVNPRSPAIGLLGRAFSADPQTVAAHCEAFMAGMKKAGILGSYKHFPGHGNALTDTHDKLADITETWTENELVPYTNLPSDGPFMVMAGHLVHRKFDERPASLSQALITGLLREKLGWQGVVVTDDLEMDGIAFFTEEERVRLAIEAGVDIILFGNNLKHSPKQGRKIHGIIKKLVEDGVIPEKRIAESWARIRTLKARL